MRGLGEIFNILFPQACALCKVNLSADENHICSKCLDTLVLLRPPFCPKCSRHVYKEGVLCPECIGKTTYISGMFSCFLYNDTFKHFLVLMKYYHNPALIKPLLPYLYDFSFEHLLGLDIDIISFVPIYWLRSFMRDLDQSFIIARQISKTLSLPLIPLLKKTRNTPQQHFLSKEMRAQNLRNSFKTMNANKLKNKKILLIDDVFTTGNTLKECAKILIKSGAKKVYGFSLARGS